ncbi:CobW family GTP-binding protein [Microbulbifer aggregans]|uniref:CobW family GTP-binding protein n=1 Tax=Microbulbifer aggregans TaxID=1769779 RepID=UPI001CFE183E|nr:CobW family GTP-binding protein [Microbulbifer aggregans]
MQAKSDIQGVAVNVITGFLGVGKTTAIRHLLESKPRDERWAVLVNEFGEVGVDGGLFGSERDGEIFIREVPGGCMCCTAGLPMQVALNQLLARARPHRLLIEPTGLGHPREVLATLSEGVRTGVLKLGATLTLVDARCIEDERYLRSDTFREQLEVADLVVANKSDLYGPDDLENLRRYLTFLGREPNSVLPTVEQGRIQQDWLNAPSGFQLNRSHAPHQHHSSPTQDQEPVAVNGYRRLENSNGTYHSCGWEFGPARVFDYERLFSLLIGVEAERVKGVFITERGVFGFNKADAVLSVLELDDTLDSRVEVIDHERHNWEELEHAFLAVLCSG